MSVLIATAWRAAANCRDMPTAVFFPAAGDRVGMAAAKAVCEHCPSRLPCLDYSLHVTDTIGVWAGLGEYSRRRLRKARRVAATRPPARRDSRGPGKGTPSPPRRRRRPASAA